MFSKILVKLIDQSVLPAILLLSVRLISVTLLANHFGIMFEVGFSGFVFDSQTDYILINSYSLLFMVMALMLGLAYVLLKSLLMHDTHISPSMTAKLFTLKVSSLIQNSFNIYSQGVIWVSYLYLLTLVSGLMLMFHLLYAWVFYVSLAGSIISTVIFILDFERELQLAQGEKQMSDEDFALNFGDEYV